jgi:hypothetical protein
MTNAVSEAAQKPKTALVTAAQAISYTEMETLRTLHIRTRPGETPGMEGGTVTAGGNKNPPPPGYPRLTCRSSPS